MSEFDIQATLWAFLRQKITALRTKRLEMPYGQPVHACEINGYRSALDTDLAALDQ